MQKKRHTLNDVTIVTKSYNLTTLPLYLCKTKKVWYTEKSKNLKGKHIMLIRHFRYNLPAFLIASALLLTVLSGCNPIADNSSSAPSSQNSSSVGQPDTASDDTTFDSSSEAANKTSSLPAHSSSSSKAQSYSGGTDGTVDLFAAGDNIYHDSVINSGRTANGFDFTHYYEYLANDIKNADIAMINQESPLGGEALGIGGYPNFNSPQELGDNLVSLGFDVISQANNHMLDKGAKGITKTIQFWKKYPQIALIGINESQSERNRTRIIERNGVKIAFLAYTYGTNGYKVPSGQDYLINMIDRAAIKKDVERAKGESDAIVVSIHWGVEYSTTTSSTQTSLAQYLADLGVDLVIGHHPHVIQRVNWVTGSGGNKTLVYYSLGNFLSSQEKVPRMLGAVANVRFAKKNGTTSITQAKITPVVTHFEYDGSQKENYQKKDFKIYKLSEYTEALASHHGIKHYDNPFSVSTLQSLAKNVLKDWYTDEKE